MLKKSAQVAMSLALSVGTVFSVPVQAQVAPVSGTWAATQDYVSAVSSLDILSVREALQNIWVHGLNPAVYWSEDFEKAYNSGLIQDTSVRSAILSSYLKALRDLTVGSVDPTNLASDVKMQKKDFYSVSQISSMALTSGMNASALLEQVAPQSAAYLSLKEAMRRLYPLFLKGGWDRISPVNKELSLGSRHPVIVKLKERLKVHGYAISNMDDSFDQEMLQAINDVQANLKIKPDGRISPGGKTWGFFWVFCGERVRQIQADMEKLRWLPQRLEDRHIFVNTAFSHFVLTDKTQNKVISFRTINGSVQRKTPTMRDKVTYLVFNPTWTVPPTVFINDKVEIIKNLDGEGIRNYFAQNNFEVYSSDFTKTIDPTSINWKGINSAYVDFYIRQRPNYMNALGVVKFMMTNPYAIYLHDTNQRELFSEAQRLRSSGCVRLEKPLDLAEYLLAGTEWTRPQIENFVVKPGEVMLKETRVNLKNPISVYLMPVTSQLSSDGVIRFVEDAYGHNQLILSKIKGIGR